MADSSPQANNVTIKFRRKAETERPRAMPVVSTVQNAAMHSAAEGKSSLGIPKKVGAEFVADQKPGDVKDLPKRKNKMMDRLRAAGRISDKQADKFGEK